MASSATSQHDEVPLGYAAPVSPGTLNDDFERRPYWHATMPRAARPPRPPAPGFGGRGRRRRRLHGRHRGPRARPPRRGRHAARGRDDSGSAARRATAASSIPGYKWGPRTLIKRYGEETGRELFRDTLDAFGLVKRLIADEAIDCEFRECGYLDLAYGAVARRRLDRGRPDARRLRRRGRVRAHASSSGRRSAATSTTAAWPWPRAGCSIPGKYFAGLADGRGARGRRPPRRRPGAGRSAARPTGGSSSRPTAARSSRRTSSSGRTATRTDSSRRSAGGSSRSAATSSRPSRSPRTSPRSSRRRAGRSSTRRTSSTTGTSRPTAGWSSAGGPASCRRSVDRTAAILHKGMLEVHPQLAGYRVDYAWGGNVGFTFDRMPHVGTHGWRHVRDGLLRDGRRTHDLAGNGGRGLAVRRCGAGTLPAEVPAGTGSVRGPALVPAVRRRVVPAPRPN